MPCTRKFTKKEAFTKPGLIESFSKDFTETKFYGQGDHYFAFPGRGIVNKVLRVKRDHSVIPLEKTKNPRVILAVGRVSH